LLFVCTVAVFLTSFSGNASIFCKIIKINSKLSCNRRVIYRKSTTKGQRMTSDMNKQIIVLGTGGTIAGKSASATDNVDYVASEVGVEALLAAIPSLAGLDGRAIYGDCELVCEQVAQVDSKDMTFEVWQRLLARCTHWMAQPQVQGIVITHGTDTLEETAFFLHSVLERTKPVVLTCAMRPSTAVAPDGPQNLLDALAVVSSDQIKAVVAVCASTIHSAVDVQKVHNYRLDAFNSGDAGALGYVKEGRLAIYRNIESNMPLADVNVDYVAINNIVNLTQLPRVEIVLNHSGATGDIVLDLLAQRSASSANKLAGIVVAATGNGTISLALERALQTAEAAGVVVWRSSRCAFGTLVGKADVQFGDSGGLTPVKARIALMLHLI
jgi:L-asparaginase